MKWKFFVCVTVIVASISVATLAASNRYYIQIATTSTGRLRTTCVYRIDRFTGEIVRISDRSKETETVVAGRVIQFLGVTVFY